MRREVPILNLASVEGEENSESKIMIGSSFSRRYGEEVPFLRPALNQGLDQVAEDLQGFMTRAHDRFHVSRDTVGDTHFSTRTNTGGGSTSGVILGLEIRTHEWFPCTFPTGLA